MYAQAITLNEKNTSLDKVFKQIEQQSGYSFFYENDILKQAFRVSINIKNATLAEALEKCFTSHPLTYTLVENTIVVKAKERSLVQK